MTTMLFALMINKKTKALWLCFSVGDNADRKQQAYLTTHCIILWWQDTALSATMNIMHVKAFLQPALKWNTTRVHLWTAVVLHHVNQKQTDYFTNQTLSEASSFFFFHTHYILADVIPVCSGTVMCSLQSPLTTAFPPLSSCLTIGPSSGSFSILSLISCKKTREKWQWNSTNRYT